MPSLRYRRERGDIIDTYNYTHSTEYTVNKDLLVRNEGSVTQGHSQKTAEEILAVIVQQDTTSSALEWLIHGTSSQRIP